jgi:hypothetical protein
MELIELIFPIVKSSAVSMSVIGAPFTDAAPQANRKSPPFRVGLISPGQGKQCRLAFAGGSVTFTSRRLNLPIGKFTVKQRALFTICNSVPPSGWRRLRPCRFDRFDHYRLKAELQTAMPFVWF